MFRRPRRSRAGRVTALALMALVPWLFGPSQTVEAATRWAREEAQRRAGRAQRLDPNEMRAIRGSATWPGPPRHWQYAVPVLGGYGRVNCMSINLHVAIPVVGYAGKGVPVSVSLHFDSPATSTGTSAKPPIASGWTHTYNVYLTGAGTNSVTVVEGDGSRNTFSRILNGPFTAPAGNFDTLVRNTDGTYKVTRKNGVVLNFGSNNKLASIVDLNGNTTRRPAFSGTTTTSSSRSRIPIRAPTPSRRTIWASGSARRTAGGRPPTSSTAARCWRTAGRTTLPVG